MVVQSFDPHFLERIPLFNDLTLEELSLLSSFLHPSSYPTGTVLIRAEDTSARAYILLQGTIKVHVEQANGRNVILAILGPGQIVGEMSIADSLECSATVVTLEESHLLWIDRERLQVCLKNIPALQSNMLRLLSSRLRMANAHIQALATLDTSGRVARHLLAFAQEYGHQVATGTLIPIRLTQEDLADLTGVSPGLTHYICSPFSRSTRSTFRT